MPCWPAPVSAMVSYFQSVIGIEAHQQMLNQHSLPDRVYACVGGGSNAIGIFQGFMNDDVELVGVEAGGKGDKPGQHASRIATKQSCTGIAPGFKTKFLQNDDGQLQDTYSIAAGLDYVGISPILADWSDSGKIRVEKSSDEEVVAAIGLLISHEGIIPAIESAHALACVFREAKKMSHGPIILSSLKFLQCVEISSKIYGGFAILGIVRDSNSFQPRMALHIPGFLILFQAGRTSRLSCGHLQKGHD